jgi:pimeloyl-ACP methyl ester carboxylesterase
MNSPNGLAALSAERDDIARQCWQAWSPTWRFDESFVRECAKSFQNSDWIDTTIHATDIVMAMRLAIPLQRYEELLWRSPKISVSAIALAGDTNPFYPPSSLSNQRSFYTDHYEQRVLRGIGHNVPKEHPSAFVQAVKDVMAVSSAR